MTKAILIVLAIFLFIIYNSLYVVSETQQVVLTQFGKVIGEPVTSPGLHPKIPFIQKPTHFQKNLLSWDGEPGEIPTQDKTYIWVDTFARWKIVDALQFFKTVKNESQAKGRLNEILDSEIRNLITAYPLIETVRKSNRTFSVLDVSSQTGESRYLSSVSLGREKIVKLIMDQAKPKLANFGIELVDLKIKRLNYTEEVLRSAYQRMIAERKQIAEKFRSEGQGEARKIEGDQEREMKRITSEAYRTAQEIRGKADGEATRIYADAFNRDPDFYSFVQTLDIYKRILEKDSTLVLSTDSDFLKYIKNINP